MDLISTAWSANYIVQSCTILSHHRADQRVLAYILHPTFSIKAVRSVANINENEQSKLLCNIAIRNAVTLNSQTI